MGNRIIRLLRHAFGRRQNANHDTRVRPDHPERLPPDQLPTTRDVEQSSRVHSTAVAATQTATLPVTTSELGSSLELTTNISEEAGSITTESIDSVILPPIKCSNFYLACRNGKIEEVEKLLETITHDDIDRKEPNGSTALHAAAYHGHLEIVRLLLQAGADRAIKNKFGCLPFDEAADDAIKELFLRIPNTNRFVSNTGAIEWELINDDVSDTAQVERYNIKSLYENASGYTSVDKMFEKIEKNYANQGLNNFVGVANIIRFFRKANEEKDPTWIIKAYTAETDFYKILNREIAGGSTQFQNERKYIIALLWHHPKLDPLAYTGLCYRVVQVNFDDLRRYQAGRLLMTKSFLSSSIDKQIAELHVCRQEVEAEDPPSTRFKVNNMPVKIWIMCIYHIKHRRSALHIEESSQYANEAEVLIMPYTVFKVKHIEELTPESLPVGHKMTQIELEEC